MLRLIRSLWTRHPDGDGTPPGPILGGVPLGPRPWLVLGGGGLKGLAHLGAWTALQRAGFRPVGVVGTSIGALVGACLASGRPLDDLLAAARQLRREDLVRVQRRAVWVNGIRAPAVLRGDVFQRYIDRLLPDQGWGDLTLPLQVNAVELGSGRTEWFGAGARTDATLTEAVYASAALPVLYPPLRLQDGKHYVDGGTIDALPLARAQELGATAIVAMDVGSGEQADGEKVVEAGLVSVHQRVYSIMSGRRRRDAVLAWTGVPLLYIRPRLDGYGTFDFEHIEYFLEEGERAAAVAVGVEDGRPVNGRGLTPAGIPTPAETDLLPDVPPEPRRS